AEDRGAQGLEKVCVPFSLQEKVCVPFSLHFRFLKLEVDDYQWQHTSNPYAGDAQAIESGRSLYRRTCYICHLDSGGRGPNLRNSKLKERDFIRVVLNGQRNTQMPAWKGKISEEQMWKILAYLEAPPAQ
ncbi:MAG: c-type cytochrome, partial [Burkholderiales bacterium]